MWWRTSPGTRPKRWLICFRSTPSVVMGPAAARGSFVTAAEAALADRRTRAARVIAFYLPQFHPIPENEEWWGPGFTEWTNAARARPLYRGHAQPHLPADLGFYDLRLPESRQAQAELARRYGVEAFCYWHYWFAGRRILERPYTEMLASGVPDFPFCLGWANQTWSGVWYGDPSRVLIEQTYPGPEDDRRHFETCCPLSRTAATCGWMGSRSSTYSGRSCCPTRRHL